MTLLTAAKTNLTNYMFLCEKIFQATEKIIAKDYVIPPQTPMC